MDDQARSKQTITDEGKLDKGTKRDYICDRCGYKMDERNCKIICPNCGNRFDCSDLNLHFDD